MKATELRLGNLVLHKGQVIEISMARYIEDFNDGKIELNPIPLTDEWLVKFGFTKDCDVYLANKGTDKSLCIWKWDSLSFAFTDWEGHTKVTLNYVHQLQNLYFALTGEELEPKP